MKVAVIGGTGGLGTLVVSELIERGHHVRIISRNAPRQLPAGVEHSAADIGSGDGVEAALEGIEAVLDAVNSQKHAEAVLVEGTRGLLDAELRAGIRHHIEISIVGCDLIPIGYYNAKVAQEKVVMNGPVPWTLLRATQFHGFIDYLLGAVAKYRIAPTGSAKFQPVDAREVAARLVDAVERGPSGRVHDIGGPEVLTLTELSAIRRAHHGNRLLSVRIPFPGRAGRAMRAGSACLDNEGRTTWVGFAEWLDRSRDDRTAATK